MKNKRSHELINKVITLAISFSLVFVFLIVSLYRNQVGLHSEYASVSDKNRIRNVSVASQRGDILNSYGKEIVKDIPSYSISIIRKHLQGKSRDSLRNTIFNFISKLKTPEGEQYVTRKGIDNFWNKRYTYGAYEEIKIIENIDQKALTYVEERLENLPGVVISTDYKRFSPNNMAYTHIVGYIDAINDDKFFAKNPEYKKGDKIGKMGLEKEYEKELKGVDGFYYIEVNSRGQRLRVLKDRKMELPQKGNTIHTSINKVLQEAAYKYFPDSLRGSFVAIEPSTGRVLALYSNPSFNNEIFSLTKRLRRIEWNKLYNNKNRPLQNRAINGKYPLGSTFKPITSLAGLVYAHLNPNHNEVTCTGRYKFGNRYYKCWKTQGHGKVNMYKALQQSCNIYFYVIGQKIGINNLNKVAESFGLDEVSGIDLPNESRGKLDSPERYNTRYKSRHWKWTKGLLLNAAIGQNGSATPIQIANYMAAFANRKYLFTPTIVDSIVDYKDKAVFYRKMDIKKYLNYSDSLFDVVEEGMRMVVNDPGGTGKASRLKHHIVVGKTGSSQTIAGKNTTALFVGYVPRDNPEIAFACVVEDGGHGGRVAAPIVGKILREYYGE